MLNKYFAKVPLIAILRGITPAEAKDVGMALYRSGFRCIEVPLNSPSPCQSIALLREHLPEDCLIGAGTVSSMAEVNIVAAAGGRLIVMPHGDPAVIRHAKQAGLYCAPGVATPTEAMAVLALGADAVKLFPAEQLPPKVVKAWRSVFPKTAILLPVGGIEPESMSEYWKAGADGFGIGSALYAPGRSVTEIELKAQKFVAAVHTLNGA